MQINSRLLAKLISNAGFNKILSDTEFKTYSQQIKKIINKGGVTLPNKCSLKTLLDISYNHLQDDYRHEYIYKTKLLSDYILTKYSLTDSIVLNEFRIGKSVADMVLVNGTNKVFEIKTELDSPERLKTQLDDYYKGFSEVYIVTHHSLSKKYCSIVDYKIGIIEFDSNFQFQTIREASKDSTKLDNLAMMKSLRKAEFLKIVGEVFGKLPDVKQVALYRECLNMISHIKSTTVQRYYLNSIKLRINSTQQFVLSDSIPAYLKFYCYMINFTEKQYIGLPSRLSCLV